LVNYIQKVRKGKENVWPEVELDEREVVYIEMQVTFRHNLKQYGIYVKFRDRDGRIVDIAPLMWKWKGQSWNKFIDWLCTKFQEVKVVDLNLDLDLVDDVEMEEE